ncbi:Kinesin-like protein kif21b [Chytridiales sp. JEL 0842]|nr:Kinesin-like protein kif21b [Chytridiales sp. JEL 0842]
MPDLRLLPLPGRDTFISGVPGLDIVTIEGLLCVQHKNPKVVKKIPKLVVSLHGGTYTKVRPHGKGTALKKGRKPHVIFGGGSSDISGSEALLLYPFETKHFPFSFRIGLHQAAFDLPPSLILPQVGANHSRGETRYWIEVGMHWIRKTGLVGVKHLVREIWMPGARKSELGAMLANPVGPPLGYVINGGGSTTVSSAAPSHLSETKGSFMAASAPELSPTTNNESPSATSLLAAPSDTRPRARTRSVSPSRRPPPPSGLRWVAPRYSVQIDRKIFTGGDTIYLTFKLSENSTSRSPSPQPHIQPSTTMSSTFSSSGTTTTHKSALVPPKLQRESTILSFASNLPKLKITRTPTFNPRLAKISFRLEEKQIVRAPRDSEHLESVNEAHPVSLDSYVGSQMASWGTQETKEKKGLGSYEGLECKDPEAWVVEVEDVKVHAENVWGEEFEGEFTIERTVAITVPPIFTLTEMAAPKSNSSWGRHVLVDRRKKFTYDTVFGPDATQEQVYEHQVKGLVGKFLEGVNVTVMAYGQTGTGKTCTMGSAKEFLAEYGATPEQEGIIPRAVHDVFNAINVAKQTQPDAEFNLSVTFLEVYNEDLIDLFNVNNVNGVKQRSHQPILIQEDSNGMTKWSGVKEIHVDSAEEIIRLFGEGLDNRQTSITEMNFSSSRSHAILSLLLRQKHKNLDKDEQRTLVSRFHFVDLAGSERLTRTGSVGVRQREGIYINSGLLALRNVISALGDEKVTHVPYRDSKLTRILQDSLGGNSNTLMIACVSPCESDLAETLNTLKYANRAHRVKNSAIVNVETGPEAEIQQLREMVAKLREENAILRSGSSDASAPSAEAESLRQENIMLRRDLEVKSEEILRLKAHRDYLSNELAFIQSESVMRLYASSPTPSETNIPSSDLISDTESVSSVLTAADSVVEIESNAGSTVSTGSRIPLSKKSSRNLSRPGSVLGHHSSGPSPRTPTTTSTSERRLSLSGPVNPTSTSVSAASAVLLSAESEEQERQIRRLKFDLREMTLAAQDYMHQLHILKGQVERQESALEMQEAQSKDLEDVVDVLKTKEAEALKKVEVLERDHEKVLGKMRELEVKLSVNGDLETLVSHLEKSLKETQSKEADYITQIGQLQSQLSSMESLTAQITKLEEDVKHWKALAETSPATETETSVDEKDPHPSFAPFAPNLSMISPPESAPPSPAISRKLVESPDLQESLNDLNRQVEVLQKELLASQKLVAEHQSKEAELLSELAKFSDTSRSVEVSPDKADEPVDDMSANILTEAQKIVKEIVDRAVSTDDLPDTQGANLADAIWRAETAEAKLAFIYSSEDLSALDKLTPVASGTHKQNGPGLVQGLMGRFGLSDNNLEEVKRKLTASESTNQKIRDEVKLLKVKMQAMSKETVDLKKQLKSKASLFSVGGVIQRFTAQRQDTASQTGDDEPVTSAIKEIPEPEPGSDHIAASSARSASDPTDANTSDNATKSPVSPSSTDEKALEAAESKIQALMAELEVLKSKPLGRVDVDVQTTVAVTDADVSTDSQLFETAEADIQATMEMSDVDVATELEVLDTADADVQTIRAVKDAEVETDADLSETADASCQSDAAKSAEIGVVTDLVSELRQTNEAESQCDSVERSDSGTDAHSLLSFADAEAQVGIAVDTSNFESQTEVDMKDTATQPDDVSQSVEAEAQVSVELSERETQVDDDMKPLNMLISSESQTTIAEFSDQSVQSEHEAKLSETIHDIISIDPDMSVPSIDTLKLEVDVLSKDLEAANSSLASQQAAVATLMAEAANNEKMRLEAISEAAKAKEDLEAIQSELREIKANIEETARSAPRAPAVDPEKEKLIEEIASLKARLTDFSELRTRLLDTANKHHTAEEMAAARDEISALSADLQALKKSNEDMIKEYQEKLKSAERDLESNQVEIDGLKSHIASSSTVYTKTLETLVEAQKQFDEERTRHAQTSRELEVASLACKELKEKLDLLSAEYESSVTQLRSEYNGTHAALTAELETVRAEIGAKEEHLSRAIEEKSTLKSRLEAVDSVLSERSEKHTRSLAEQAGEAAAITAAAVEMGLQYEKQIEEHKARASALEAELEVVRIELEVKEESLSRSAANESATLDLKSHLAEATNVNVKLTQESSAQQLRIKKMESELEHAQNTLQEVEAQLAAATKERDENISKVSTLEARIAQHEERERIIENPALRPSSPSLLSGDDSSNIRTLWMSLSKAEGNAKKQEEVIHRLEGRVAELTQSLLESKHALTKIQDELTAESEKTAQFENLFKVHSARATDLERINLEESTRIVGVEKQLEEVKQRASKLEELVQIHSERADRFEREALESSGKAQSLEHTSGSALLQIAELEKEVEQKSSAVETLQAEVSQLTKKIQDSLTYRQNADQHQAKLEERIAELETAKTKVEESLAEMSLQITTLQRREEDLKAALATEKELAAQLTAEKEAAIAERSLAVDSLPSEDFEVLASEVETLKKELDDARSRSADLDAVKTELLELKVVAENLNMLQAELEESKSQLASSESAKKDLEFAVASLKSSTEILTAEKAQLQADLDLSKKTTELAVETLETQKAQLQADLEKALSQAQTVSELESKYASTVERLEASEQHLQSVQSELDQAAEKLKEMESLREKLKSAQQSLAVLEETKQDFVVAQERAVVADALERELQMAHESLGELEVLKKELQEAKALLDEAESIKLQLLSTKEEHLKEVEDLKAELAEANKQSKQVDILKADLARAKELQKDIDSLRFELAEAESRLKEVDTLKEQLTLSQSQIQQAEVYKHELNRLQSELELSKKRIVEIDSLKEELSRAQSEAHDAEVFKTELAQMRVELARTLELVKDVDLLKENLNLAESKAQKVDSLQEELQQLQLQLQDIGKLQMELEDARGAVKEVVILKAQIDLVSQSRDSLQKDLERSLLVQAEMESVKSELLDAKALLVDLDNLKTQCEDLKQQADEVGKLKAENLVLAERIAEMNATMEGYIESKAQVLKLESEVSALEKSLEDARQLAALKSAEIVVDSREATTAETSYLDALEYDVDASLNDVKAGLPPAPVALKETIVRDSSEFQVLEAERDEASKKVELMESEVGRLKESLSQLETASGLTLATVKQLEASIESLTKERDMLIEQVAALKAALVEKEEMLVKFAKEEQSLPKRRDVAVVTDESKVLAGMPQDADRDLARIATLTQELGAKEQRIEDLEAILQELSSKSKATIRQLESKVSSRDAEIARLSSTSRLDAPRSSVNTSSASASMMLTPSGSPTQVPVQYNTDQKSGRLVASPPSSPPSKQFVGIYRDSVGSNMSYTAVNSASSSHHQNVSRVGSPQHQHASNGAFQKYQEQPPQQGQSPPQMHHQQQPLQHHHQPLHHRQLQQQHAHHAQYGTHLDSRIQRTASMGPHMEPEGSKRMHVPPMSLSRSVGPHLMRMPSSPTSLTAPNGQQQPLIIDATRRSAAQSMYSAQQEEVEGGVRPPSPASSYEGGDYFLPSVFYNELVENDALPADNPSFRPRFQILNSMKRISSMSSREYVDVLRRQVVDLEVILGQYRRRILDLQARVGALEVSNSTCQSELLEAKRHLGAAIEARRRTENRYRDLQRKKWLTALCIKND